MVAEDFTLSSAFQVNNNARRGRLFLDRQYPLYSTAVRGKNSKLFRGQTLHDKFTYCGHRSGRSRG